MAAVWLLEKPEGSSAIHRLEQSLAVGWAILAAGGMVYVFVVYGIPLIALWLAEHMPPAANAIVATQALQVLDRTFLSPSKLNAADTQKAQMLFGEVAAQGKRGPAAYRLLLRDAPRLGPNAIALPDGTIVMTDELWPMVKADDELEGVFAHEIAHVDRAHSLQGLYQAALVPAAIALATGDLSQISQIATLLPGVLLQAAYSRRLEQQADDDAAIVVKRLGGDPSHLADLLERMEARLCQKATCPPNWLGTHPESRLRAIRLRSAGAAAELKP
jgi:Zn-dependent protease with chaperone function